MLGRYHMENQMKQADNMTPMAHGLGDEVTGNHDATYECDPAKDLASGSSDQGMTMNGLGGLSAADLAAGFSDGEYHPPPPPADDTIANTTMDLLNDGSSGGFLGRPHGWER
jgi:hypothetical protein